MAEEIKSEVTAPKETEVSTPENKEVKSTKETEVASAIDTETTETVVVQKDVETNIPDAEKPTKKEISLANKIAAVFKRIRKRKKDE